MKIGDRVTINEEGIQALRNMRNLWGLVSESWLELFKKDTVILKNVAPTGSTEYPKLAYMYFYPYDVDTDILTDIPEHKLNFPLKFLKSLETQIPYMTNEPGDYPHRK